MKLTVKTITGKKHLFEMDTSATILQVKEEILKVDKDAEVERTKLIYKGKMLANDATLDSCGITEKEFLSKDPKQGFMAIRS